MTNDIIIRTTSSPGNIKKLINILKYFETYHALLFVAIIKGDCSEILGK